jgi:hypothetical protein
LSASKDYDHFISASSYDSRDDALMASRFTGISDERFIRLEVDVAFDAKTAGPMMLINSLMRTVPSSGQPMPSSQRPKAMSLSSRCG